MEKSKSPKSSDFNCYQKLKILHPSGKYRNQDTKSLAALIMGYMKANTDSCPNYTRNLALLVGTYFILFFVIHALNRESLLGINLLFSLKKRAFTVHLKLG